MIINCTQHLATPEQLAAGVIDFPEPARTKLIKLLTFEELPTIDIIHERSRKICALVDEVFDDVVPKVVLLGGAPFLMGTLERYIIFRGWTPLYAFSKRESVEEVQPDGSVKKASVFRHAGFVKIK